MTSVLTASGGAVSHRQRPARNASMKVEAVLESISSRLPVAMHCLQACNLCEHRCGVNRAAGELGVCRAGATPRVFRHRVEWGEEEELCPSHVFYLSGCDWRCCFCIAEENAFDPERGVPLTGEYLRRAIRAGRERDARNIQWLGGEANIHLPGILSAMAEIDDLPPVVWKSNLHMTPEVFDLLDGVASVYLADFKFGNDDCAKTLARVENHHAIVTRNLRLAAERADLIVRHLVMPNHVDCCTKPVVRWMAEHLPHVKFSLRDGYLPRWQARRASMDRTPSGDEISGAASFVSAAELRSIR
jgi:putative pyruvate formate lyase activating enzyme